MSDIFSENPADNKVFTREDFDYKGYAKQYLGVPEDRLDELLKTDKQRKIVYDNAVSETYKELAGKGKSLKHRIESAKSTLDILPDGREVLGVPEEDEDQTRPFKRETFSAFLEETYPEKYRDIDISVAAKKYQKLYEESPEAKFMYPAISGLDSSGFKTLLEENTGVKVKGITVADALAEMSKPIVAEDQPSDDGAVINEEGVKETPLLDPETGKPLVDDKGKVIMMSESERGSALGRSVDTLQRMLGSGLVGIGDLIGPESSVGSGLRKFGREYIAEQDEDIKYSGYVPRYKEGLVDTMKEEGVMSFFPWFAEKAQEKFAPSVVALGGTVAAGAVGGPVGLAILAGTGLTTAVESIGEVRDELEQKGVYDPDDALSTVATGAAVAAVDLVPGGKAAPGLKTAVFKYLAEKGLLKKLGKEIVEKTATKELAAASAKASAKAAAKSKGIKSYAVYQGKQLAKPGLAEAGAEEVQDLLSIGNAWLHGAEYKPSDVAKRFVDTAVLSGAYGTGFHVAGSKINSLKNRGRTNVPTGEISVGDNPVVFVRTYEDGTVAFKDGKKYTGQTEEEVVANIKEDETSSAEQKQPAPIKKTTAKKKIVASKDGLRATYDGEEGSVTFFGENAKGELSALLGKNDVSGKGTLTIVKNKDGNITAETGSSKSTSQDIVTAVEDVGFTVTPFGEDVKAGKGAATTTSKLTVVPVKETRVDDVEAPVATKNDNGVTVIPKRPLNESFGSDIDGFHIISEVGEKGSNTIHAYKDGFIYEIKVPSRRTKSRVATVKVMDVFGNNIKLPDNIKTQELIDNEGRVVKDSITIHTPLKGVRVHNVNVAGADKVLIDPVSINNIAKNIGAEPDIVTPDFATIYHPESKKYSVFKVDDSGNIVAAIEGGKPVQVEGSFDIIDTKNHNVTTLAVEAKKLTDKGYSVTKAGNGSVELKNESGKTASVSASEEGIVVDEDGNKKIIEPEQAEEYVVEPEESGSAGVDTSGDFGSIVPDSEVRTKNIIYNEGKNLYVSEDPHNTLDVTIENENGPDVISVGGGRSVDDAVHSMRVFALPQVENVSLDELNWTADDLRKFVKAVFPDHIASIINIHESVVNPASMIGAWGYFSPSEDNGRPVIHIDASKSSQIGLQQVLETIAEETGHFSFDSWFVPEMTELVEIAFSIAKTEIETGLQQYYSRNSIDLNNPSIQDKWLLVNEFFSKQGTSILDFKSNQVSLPPGITQAHIEELKKSVVGKIVKEDITIGRGAAAVTAKEFIEKVLRLQAGGVLGKQVVLQFTKDNKAGQGSTTIKVYTLPVGRRVVTHGTERVAERLAKEKEKATSYKSQWRRKFQRWLLHNGIGSFYNSPIGNRAAALIGGAFKAVSANTNSALTRALTSSIRVRAILHEHGMRSVSFDKSYVETFKALGITNKSQLALAEEMDSFMQSSVVSQFENVSQIRDLFREAISSLDELTKNDPSARKNYFKWRRELEKEAQRFAVEWTNRRYSVYTERGQKEVNTMLNALKRIETGDNATIKTVLDAGEARKEIKSIKRKMRSGQMSKSEGNAKILELSDKISLVGRLESLAEWARVTLERKGITAAKDIRYKEKLYSLMRERMEGIIGEYDSFSKGGTTQKLELISANMHRKLDWEDPIDKLLVKFLDPIEDPLENAIVNLDQQSRIIAALAFNNKLAREFLSTGIARLIGSDRNISEFTGSEADRSIGLFQKGTLLKYLEIDPFYSDFIKKELALHGQIRDIGMGRTVGFIKRGFTVLNQRLLLSNFWSNIPAMLQGGHLFTNLSNLAQGSEAIAKGFRKRLLFGANENAGNSPAEMILREMADNNVTDSSWSQLQVDITKTDVIERVFNIMTGLVEKPGLVTGKKTTGLITTDTKLVNDARFKNFLDTLAEMYGYGDDYAKIIPYILNRQMGILKAGLVIRRDAYQYGTRGDIEYNKAIVDYAVQYAAERTLRDSTQWVISPYWIRNASAQRTKFFLSDWLMFPAQMAKIDIENKRIMYEDKKEYSEHMALGNTEYAYFVRNRLAARVAGNVLIDAGKASSAVAGISGTTAIVAGLIALVRGDADDDKKKRDEHFSADELIAAQRLLANAVYSGYSVNYPLVFGKRKDSFLVWNGSRIAATNSWSVTKPLTEDGVMSKEVLKSYLKQLGQNFLAGDDTIAQKLINFGHFKDDDGKRITVRQAFFEAAEFLTPEDLDAAIIAATGKTISGKKKDKLEYLFGMLTGVGVKRVYIPELINQVAYGLKEVTSTQKNPVYDEMLDRIAVGEKLDRKDINSIMSRQLRDNKTAVSRANAAITQFRKLHYSDDEILTYLTINARGGFKKTGFPKKKAKMLLKGKGNPFDRSIETSLENKLKSLSKATPSKGEKSRYYNAEQLKYARENVALALNMIEEYNSKNKNLITGTKK